jgi:hypothetical protein
MYVYVCVCMCMYVCMYVCVCDCVFVFVAAVLKSDELCVLMRAFALAFGSDDRYVYV